MNLSVHLVSTQERWRLGRVLMYQEYAAYDYQMVQRCTGELDKAYWQRIAAFDSANARKLLGITDADYAFG